MTDLSTNTDTDANTDARPTRRRAQPEFGARRDDTAGHEDDAIRQGEIILRTPTRRAVFIGGLTLFVLFLLAMSVLT